MNEAKFECQVKIGQPVTSLVVPSIGRDEMNLIEFPLGPIKSTKEKSWETTHVVRDRKSKKLIERTVLITAADSFGLPRPIDEQVLVALKALTHENGFAKRKVHFSRYQLCRTLGWQADGRAYKRLEDSFDRLVGTTFKYRNAWWDKSDQCWRSLTFHLLDNVELCSNARYRQFRRKTKSRSHALCFFVWNDVIWKSFTDGYIKKINMDTFRRIASGRRREVPLRLYRWLDKHFYRKSVTRIDVMKLGIGTLGLSNKYPSDCVRVIKRAAEILIQCQVLADVEFTKKANSRIEAVFSKHNIKPERAAIASGQRVQAKARSCEISKWFGQQDSNNLLMLEAEALEIGFGKKLERDLVLSSRDRGNQLTSEQPIRLHYIRRYCKHRKKLA